MKIDIQCVCSVKWSASVSCRFQREFLNEQLKHRHRCSLQRASRSFSVIGGVYGSVGGHIARFLEDLIRRQQQQQHIAHLAACSRMSNQFAAPLLVFVFGISSAVVSSGFLSGLVSWRSSGISRLMMEGWAISCYTALQLVT